MLRDFLEKQQSRAQNDGSLSRAPYLKVWDTVLKILNALVSRAEETPEPIVSEMRSDASSLEMSEMRNGSQSEKVLEHGAKRDGNSSGMKTVAWSNEISYARQEAKRESAQRKVVGWSDMRADHLSG